MEKINDSNHDFEKTLDVDEMIHRLCRMQALGAALFKSEMP